MDKKSFLITLSAVTVLFGCTSAKPTAPVAKKLTPHELIKSNRILEAKNQFVMPNDINAADANGDTVLHLAAAIDDAELVTYFIFKGADPELKNYDSDTPLHVAIRNNAFEAARALAATSSTLFARDADGITALDLGLTTDPSYYDIFITTKAGEIRDVDNQTIVHYFVKAKNLLGVQKCIEKKIPVSIKDDNGKTPLDIAFENIDDEESVEIAAELIMAGADEVETEFAYFQDAIQARNVNSRFDDGQTPLHLLLFTVILQLQNIF